MAHKEWEPDEFLDEFLDFDYRKPVPEHSGKHSKGLPAEKVSQSKQVNKSFGLSNDYKMYEELRHENSLDAGRHATEEKKAHDLRSSGALKEEILEPLSARRVVKAPQESAAKQPDFGFKKSEPVIKTNKKSDIPAPPAEASVKPAKEPKSRRRHARASEIAADALGAAKKLVSLEDELPVEEIPAAPARSAYNAAPIRKISDRDKSAAPEQKDELAELFAELGETGAEPLSKEENVALKQAQQDAYDRYRGNYRKAVRRKGGASKAGPFARWLSRIYVVALVAFAGIMTVMNVLPFEMLIAFYVVLGLLSLIIVLQLRRENVKKGIRALASMTAILLIAGFGVGTAYAMGTLSFLDFTSVTNAKRVAAITKQPFNVCITGIDVDGKIDEQGRSDVNMIVTVNPQTEQILMTSIPRDYQIYMPDKDNAMDKLTHTGFYSVDTTIGAEENLLDTSINYYVKVNFTTVKKFIDAIDGVDVYSEYEFTPVKKKDWTVQEGWNHMNGKEALAFARERKAFIDGDNQRIKNQQAVFEAIIKKATSSRTMLLSYNKILSNLRDYFQMSFSSAELRSLLKLQLAKNPQWKIYKNTIVGGNGSMPTYTTGNAYAYVMTQDESSIENARTLINAVLEGSMLEKDDDNNVYVAGGEGSGEDGETNGE